MAANDFKTVSVDAVHIAVDLQSHLEAQGYTVAIERKELGHPFTPTLLAIRGHSTLIADVSVELNPEQVTRWVKFCRSQTADTRYTIALSAGAAMSQPTMELAIQKRIGLYSHDNSQLVEIRSAPDLAVQVDLPAIGEITTALRPVFAGPFDKINNGDWRDGLSDVYLEVETRAREYLKSGIDIGRIVITRKKGPPVTSQEVDAMPMGSIKDHFKRIKVQNQQDALITNTLELMNPIRVKLTHKRLEKGAEAEIRANLGKHVHVAVAFFEEITK